MPKELPKKNPSDEELQDLDVGDEITAFWAPEKFAPVQYHSFDVGPFIARTKVREGETGLQAFERAYKVCREIARKTYPQKRDEFIESLQDAADKVRDSVRRK